VVGEEVERGAEEHFSAFLVDLAENDIRRCLNAGAASVQLDFTEGRPSKESCVISST
jgi:5-methyltetrahydropteroyltriglutamate--homocysteine methyltransferase